MDKKEVEMDGSINGFIKVVDGRYDLVINAALSRQEKEMTYRYLFHEIAVGNI